MTNIDSSVDAIIWSIFHSSGEAENKWQNNLTFQYILLLTENKLQDLVCSKYA